MFRIMPRYVRNELIPPLVLSLFVFTSVLFMRKALEISDLIISKGVGGGVLFRIILYTLPSLLWMTIPMAFLMATLTSLGRLSSDNETLAMFSLGMGISNFLKPILTLGLLLCVLNFLIGALGVPWGRSSLNRVFYELLRGKATSGIQPGTFNDIFPDLVIYADRVEGNGNILENVMIADYRGEVPETIIAEQGKIETDPSTLISILNLTNGSVHHYRVGETLYRLIHFDQYRLSLDSGSSSSRRTFLPTEKKPTEMTFSELKSAAESDPDQARIYRIQYHEKFALPFSCIVFGIIAIPFGIRIKRSGKVIGFSWSLLIVFCYYILLGAGRNLGSQGLLPPVIAAWVPNLVFGLFGTVSLVQASRRIPAAPGTIGSRFSRIRKDLSTRFRKIRGSGDTGS